MIKKGLVIFVVLSITASALNYLVYPLFSRILDPEGYVNITVALSLFTQVAAFLSSILAITIGLSKGEQHELASEKIELLQAFLFKLFFGLALLFLALSPVLMDKVHTPVFFAIPIALMMLFSIPILIVSGYLNGRNQMTKLGLVALVSAVSQFTIGLSVAFLSRNGFITMLSMVIAQLITITVVYVILSKDRLPGIIKPLITPVRSLRGKHMGKLVRYTISTSVAILAISLVQIADLFILQSLVHTNMKFYTDIYVVSRVVFFAGMIFIWPFLGEVSLDHHHFNRRPFVKLIAYFAIIALSAIAALYFFGDRLSSTLFGVDYGLQAIRDIGILSVLYKFLLLIITAIILYFVVLRRYIAVWLSLAVSGAVFVFMELTNKNLDMLTVLLELTLIASIAATIATVLLLRMPIKKS